MTVEDFILIVFFWVLFHSEIFLKPAFARFPYKFLSINCRTCTFHVGQIVLHHAIDEMMSDTDFGAFHSTLGLSFCNLRRICNMLLMFMEQL